MKDKISEASKLLHDADHVLKLDIETKINDVTQEQITGEKKIVNLSDNIEGKQQLLVVGLKPWSIPVGLHNAFGNLSETAVLLEQKVEHAKNSIGKSQNEYRNLIEEIEAKIRLEYEARFAEFDSRLPNCTKQVAFRKEVKFVYKFNKWNCDGKNQPTSEMSDRCQPIKDKRIFEYDTVEYAIGVDNSTSGNITIPVSGVYEVQ